MSTNEEGTSPRWLRIVGAAVEVRIRVVPRSSRDVIAGVLGDRLKLQVTSPPVDGAANTAVLHLVARSAALPVRSASLTAGETSRSKTVRLACEDPPQAAEAAARLVTLVAAIR